MPKRVTALVAALAAGALLGACGSSRAPGVQLAPSAGATEASVPATTPTTPTTPTTTATTPKPPSPLSKKPAVTVPKGPPPKQLVVHDLIKGTGKTAQPGKTITVNYVGALYKTGKEFDSSWKRNQPFTTPLTGPPSGVIEGWVKGIAGMKVGGRRELIIPPSLAYKNKAQGGIPANSTLIFVVDLLSVA